MQGGHQEAGGIADDGEKCVGPEDRGGNPKGKEMRKLDKNLKNLKSRGSRTWRC